MAVLEKLRVFLAETGRPFTHTQHPLAYTARGVAFAEHMPPALVAKTIVFHGPDGFGMAVLPADRRVDMNELRAALGFSHLRLATEPELSVLFPDCELGAMPPFGNLYNLPVYVDTMLTRQEEIAFNAGTHRDVVHLKYADFERLVKPTVISFSAHEELANIGLKTYDY